MECPCQLVQLTWFTAVIHLAFLSSTAGKITVDMPGLAPPDDHQAFVWSAWSSWSSCTRTCGGGVSVQKRYCVPRDSSIPNTTLPTPVITVRVTRSVGYCVGVDRRYHECNTQPCPGGPNNSRAEQCSLYDSRPFRGRYYTWVPYIDGNAPCVLNCRPLGQQFYASLALVTDGTPCTKPGARAICVQGRCDVVGLESVLASTGDVELRCGNHMVSGLFSRPKLPIGYTYVATVPRGACHLNVTELVASENYVALKVTNGSFIINGQFAVSAPGAFDAAGARFEYLRVAGRDFVYCVGPLLYSVDIMVLYTRPSPSLKYEYFTDPLSNEINMDSISVDGSDGKPPKHSRRHHAVPYMPEFGDDFEVSVTETQSTHARTKATRARTHTQPPHTTHTRPHATHTRPHPPSTRTHPSQVHTHSESETESESDSEPTRTRSAGFVTTTEETSSLNQVGLRRFTWKVMTFTECTRTCGGGSQIGKYRCVEENVKEVSPVHCVGSPPGNRRRRCNTQPCPPRWRAAAWSACPECGPANRTRVVGCVQDNSRGIVKIKDKKCPDEKPAEFELCNIPHCNPHVITYTKSEPDVGLFREGTSVTYGTRGKSHVTKEHSVEHSAGVNVTLTGWIFTDWSKCVGECGMPGVQSRAGRCAAGGCPELPRAALVRECTLADCTDQPRWYTGEWSPCSAECDGYQVRGAVCVSHGFTVLREMCTHLPPDTVRACARCTPMWFAGEWSVCEGNCSQGSVGWQQRSVVCTSSAVKDKITAASPGACADAAPIHRQPCVLKCEATTTEVQKETSKRKAQPTTPASRTTAHMATESAGPHCEDQLPNCGLAVQARLCHYNYYIKNCCKSCKSPK